MNFKTTYMLFGVLGALLVVLRWSCGSDRAAPGQGLHPPSAPVESKGKVGSDVDKVTLDVRSHRGDDRVRAHRRGREAALAHDRAVDAASISSPVDRSCGRHSKPARREGRHEAISSSMISKSPVVLTGGRRPTFS